jgi:hypothetical protein
MRPGMTDLILSMKVPANVFNMQLYVVSPTDNSSMGQYVGNGFVPSVGDNTNANYYNNTGGQQSCIYVEFPPAGDYYWRLTSQITDAFPWTGQLLFNVPQTCMIQPGAALSQQKFATKKQNPSKMY